jgi:hypothetical protein
MNHHTLRVAGKLCIKLGSVMKLFVTSASLIKNPSNNNSKNINQKHELHTCENSKC